MKLIYKKLSTILLLAMICMTYLCHVTYASFIIDATKNKQMGPGEDMLHDLGVTGDSYGGFLIDALTETYELDLQNYCKAGTTVEQNKNSIIECIHDRYKYIVISIGVNDHCCQTDIQVFLDDINLFAELAKKLDKYLIFHTYMTYPTESLYTMRCACDDYDKAIKVVASINPHVKYIDMHDINGEMYYQEDHIHYNNNFYQILIERILATLIEIQKEKCG